MIVVTGTARTGTSLMMQTLMHLGVPIVGDKFSNENEVEECNPKGYYELPIKEIVNGIHNEEYRDKGIKLFGYSLSLSDPSLISHIILCRRNKPETLDSIVKWLKLQNMV